MPQGTGNKQLAVELRRSGVLEAIMVSQWISWEDCHVPLSRGVVIWIGAICRIQAQRHHIAENIPIGGTDNHRRLFR